MVTVGNVKVRHLAKFLGYQLYVLVVANHPELVAEAIDGCHEIVLGLCLGIAHNEFVEQLIVRIGKEHRLNVGIVYANVLHAVFLLVAAGQFVFLDAAGHVVVGMGAHHESILRLLVHGLRVDVVLFLVVLHQPALFLELPEVLGSFLIDTRVILRRSFGEVYLGFNNVVEAFLVVASLGTCFLAIEHVVGTALHLLHQFLRWTDSLKWFYYHSSFFIFSIIS